MATTTLIVEILVVGIFGLIWISLVLLKATAFDASQLVKILYNLRDWSVLITILMIGIIYQLGWMINGLSFGISNFLFEKRIRNRMFLKEGLKYEVVRPTVYQDGSEKVFSDMAVERSVMRLSRAGYLNFLLIAIALLWNGGSFTKFFWIALILFMGCFFQWRQRFRRYYIRMITTFKVIQKEAESKKGK